MARIGHLLQEQAFRLKRFLLGHGGRKRKYKLAKKHSWMMPMTYGYHVVQHNIFRDDTDDSDFDSVVAQREQIDRSELWYFGIFDALIGDKVTKYMQSHFFDKKLQEVIYHFILLCIYSLLGCTKHEHFE